MRPEYDCLRCKGNNPRLYCGRDFCPIYKKLEVQKKVNLEAKKDFSGKSPNVFIGRFGYPDINVGILSAEEYNQHDNPLFWSGHDYSIQDVVNLRTELINSSFKANIKSFKTKFLDMSQEISMAVKPVDVEVSLNKKPQFKLSFNQDVMPHGPNVKLEKAEITENPKIPHAVDSIVDDTYLKANEAINALYKKGYDEHYLTKLLSVGNLGVKKERKLVPTRWSITAVDDNVGKTIINEIKDYQNYNYVAHFGSYFGNYYLILFFPEVWSYELFETYLPDALWNQKKKIQIMTDYENYNGRKEYASNTVGGYYAARLSVLEYLKSKKRQASVLALRFVTDEYWAPLGVWVVREAVRKSLQSQVIEFSSKELMIDYAKKLIKKKFGYDVSEILHDSILLREMKQQRKLSEY